MFVYAACRVIGYGWPDETRLPTPASTSGDIFGFSCIAARVEWRIHRSGIECNADMTVVAGRLTRASLVGTAVGGGESPAPGGPAAKIHLACDGRGPSLSFVIIPQRGRPHPPGGSHPRPFASPAPAPAALGYIPGGRSPAAAAQRARSAPTRAAGRSPTPSSNVPTRSLPEPGAYTAAHSLGGSAGHTGRWHRDVRVLARCPRLHRHLVPARSMRRIDELTEAECAETNADGLSQNVRHASPGLPWSDISRAFSKKLDSHYLCEYQGHLAGYPRKACR